MIDVRPFVLALLLAGVALAQEADDALAAYATATENLAAAVAAVPDDPAAAVAALARANDGRLALADASPARLDDAIDRVFDRARAAIDAGSPTDLAVQAAVLEGGIGRLLYETALRAANEGRDDVARDRLERLAADAGAGTERLAALGEDADVAELRRAFEADVAERIRARLGALDAPGVLADPARTYLAYADAYGAYLVVQDAPSLPPEVDARFVDAAGAIVDGNEAAFREAVAAIRDALAPVVEAAGEGPAPASDAAAPAAADAADPAPLPLGAEAVVPDDGATPAGADPDRLRAALASRLGAHVLRGEASEARATLDELAAVDGSSVDGSVEALLDRLRAAPALRNQDVALLSSELLEGDRPSTTHLAIDAASAAWAGPVRPAVAIALALLAILPLWLLERAFGGGHPDWRRVGVGLFLLLAPLFYEAAAGVAALLAAPLGVPELRRASLGSVVQNDLAQLAWAVVVLAGLLLMSAGLWGICVRFGVLGRGAAAGDGGAPGRATAAEWDEEA